MKLFVYEFVTGGGMAGEAPGAALVHQADLMLRALLRDLGDVPGITCLTTRDPRLPPVPGAETLTPLPHERPLDLFRRGVAVADWVWPTAPETGGILETLARAVLEAGRTLLGSAPEAIQVAASKGGTMRRLAGAGIPVVPTYRPGDVPGIDHPGRWVVKPDDGAGAEDTIVCGDRFAAERLLATRGPGAVLQPWLEGAPLSLSLLCAGGAARVLSCNRQRIRVVDGQVVLSGIRVNGAAEVARALAPLAAAVARALPGLRGYVGVDLLLTGRGPVVLEINPRLTTSWCGLREALGVNPAEWVVALARTGLLPDEIPGGQRPVDLDLEPAHAR